MKCKKHALRFSTDKVRLFGGNVVASTRGYGVFGYAVLGMRVEWPVQVEIIAAIRNRSNTCLASQRYIVSIDGRVPWSRLELDVLRKMRTLYKADQWNSV